MKDIIIKQLESYSNAVVAFNVLQSLAFSYYFGSDQFFNCHVIMTKYLAGILTIIFIFVTLSSIIAIHYFSAKLIELTPEFNKMIVNIMRGKMATVAFFGLLPAFLTFYYAVLGETPTYC